MSFLNDYGTWSCNIHIMSPYDLVSIQFLHAINYILCINVSLERIIWNTLYEFHWNSWYNHKRCTKTLWISRETVNERFMTNPGGMKIKRYREPQSLDTDVQRLFYSVATVILLLLNMGRERRWPRWIKRRCISVPSDCVVSDAPGDTDKHMNRDVLGR